MRATCVATPSAHDIAQSPKSNQLLGQSLCLFLDAFFPDFSRPKRWSLLGDPCNMCRCDICSMTDGACAQNISQHQLKCFSGLYYDILVMDLGDGGAGVGGVTAEIPTLLTWLCHRSTQSASTALSMSREQIVNSIY